MTVHLIAFGANSGFGVASNARVVARAATVLGGNLTLSNLYRSPAWPPGSGPDFVNAVGSLRMPVPPAAMLARLHAIEARFGRRRHLRWGPRVLDLDLLASGGGVRPGAAELRAWMEMDPMRQRRMAPDRLILPHPRMQDRAFVLIPLAEVAPDWRHPLTGRSVAAMRAALPRAARQGVRVIALP